MALRNVAVAHLRTGDVVQAGALQRLIPAGEVAETEMRTNPGFVWDHTLAGAERSTSHLWTVVYADGRRSEAVSGSRHVTVERAVA